MSLLIDEGLKTSRSRESMGLLGVVAVIIIAPMLFTWVVVIALLSCIITKAP